MVAIAPSNRIGLRKCPTPTDSLHVAMGGSMKSFFELIFWDCKGCTAHLPMDRRGLFDDWVLENQSLYKEADGF